MEDGNVMKLVNLGRIALVSTYMLTASSGRHLEDISHAHIVSLRYKLITSAKDTDDLSIGFDRDRGRRQRESMKNKNQKGKFHLKILLRDLFAFAEHQKKTTVGFCYKQTLTRNSDNSVLNKLKATNIGEIKN